MKLSNLFNIINPYNILDLPSYDTPEINQLCKELEQSIGRREYQQSINTVIDVQATTVQPKQLPGA